MMDFIVKLIPVLLLTAGNFLGTLEYTHMLQLESYQLDGLARWVKANKSRTSIKGGIVSLAGLAVYTVLVFFFNNWIAYCIGAAALFVGGLVSYVTYKKLPAKKPLVYTKRVKRLLVIHVLLWGLIYALIDAVGQYVVYVRVIPFFLPFLWVWTLALSARLAQPLEKAINNHYFNDAKKKLESRPDLIKVGITGSYGKTSTKFILGTLLQEKYRVLIPPSSFNTPMGLTRVIREQLKPEHEVFLAEMGARHKGDIKELIGLVHPTVGLLVSVGPQHLETFGNIETVADTKFELIEGLPKDGKAFFAADGSFCEKLYGRATMEKTLAGLDEKCPVHAENIHVTEDGSAFTLVTPQGSIDCVTPLFGKHNIQNTVLCAAAALSLGLTLAEVQSGMKKLQSVEHRLQLIKGGNGITVIDDAFNANPAGAKAAMEVLSGFHGRRMVVTPGMVELGAEEEERNREFGRQMASACDIAILIGIKRTKPIYDGLLSAGFEADNVLRVNTLKEATDFLAAVGKSGDVVLFENDLPDNYNEQ